MLKIAIRAIGSSTAFALLLGFFTPATVLAAEDTFAIEEMVVTARKRDEQLQDVPIAVTAFDATQIEDMYGNDLGEFSKHTPNVILARQPYAGNALFGGMRGIVFGDLEKSFDPAVGVVVDGVALVNNTGALIDTFDLESAEILRGPQGTLFGRNTIAGVVNLRRSRPTGEFGLKTQLRYGSHDETDVKAVLNFGVTDTLAVKVAAFMDKGDGFQEEANFDLATGAIRGTGDDIDGEDTISVYTSVLWEPTENFDALLTLEWSDDESVLATPTNLTMPNIEPLWDAITGAMFGGLAGGDPSAIGVALGTTLALGGNFCDVYGTTLAPLSTATGNPMVRDVACGTQGYQVGERNGYKYSYSAQQFINEVETKGAILELNWELDNLSITSVTGYRDIEEILDEDNLGAPVFVFNPVRPQESDQISTELTISSAFDGNLNFQAGAYYLQSEYEITQSVYVFGNKDDGITMASPDGDAGQELEAYAVFGELYWDLTDSTRLTLGGRYTRETKDFWIHQRVSGDTGANLPPTWGCGDLSGSQQASADASTDAWIAAAPDPATEQFRIAAATCADSDGEETWSEFTPRISIDHHFNDSVMAYLSWSRGFRSGGWNGRATTPNSIGPYDPETVDSYEAGLRSTLFDNRLQFNATIFRAEYEDKHESDIFAFGTSTETIVNNAAEATIDGLEIEARFVPTDRLQFRLAVGHTDGEYDEFIRGGQDVSDVLDFGFAPEWNYNIGIDYMLPIGDLGMLIFNGNYAWFDETTGNFGEPDSLGLGRNEFDDRGVSDFSITWDHPQFRIGAFVKDAFHDDNYLATSVDVEVFFFGAVAPGRTWGIELTKEF